MGKLLGTVASDLAKILISSGASTLAAMTVGAVTTIAAGPLIAAIFVGIAVGITLEAIDQRFGITDKLVAAIDEALESLFDKTFGKLARELQKVENVLEYQAAHGLQIGKGIFY